MSDMPEAPPSQPEASQPPPAAAQAPPDAPQVPPPMSTGPSAEERQMAMFAHLSALLGGLLTSAVGGWGVFIGPLIVWLVKKDTMKFVDDQGKEALNFNITVAIVVAGLCLFGLVTFTIGFLLAAPVMIAVFIAWLVLTIMASVKASEGVSYRYPFALRLIK